MGTHENTSPNGPRLRTEEKYHHSPPQSISTGAAVSSVSMLSSGRNQRATASMGSVVCARTVSSTAAADGCSRQPSCLHLLRTFPCSQYEPPPPQPSVHRLCGMYFGCLLQTQMEHSLECPSLQRHQQGAEAAATSHMTQPISPQTQIPYIPKFKMNLMHKKKKKKSRSPKNPQGQESRKRESQG